MVVIIWRTSSPWKSEKIICPVSSGQGSIQATSGTRPANHTAVLFKISINFLLLSAPPPRTDKRRPGKIECSDFIIVLPPFYSSLSLFFWVAGIGFYKPILSLTLQLWVRPVSWVTYEKHISPSLPSRSQPEHSSSVFMKDLGWTPPHTHTHTQQLRFKSSQRLFSWFPENIRVYIFLKDFRFFLPTFIITLWRQIVVKIKATRYNFFLQDKEKHNLKIVALSVFQSGRRS